MGMWKAVSKLPFPPHIFVLQEQSIATYKDPWVEFQDVSCSTVSQHHLMEPRNAQDLLAHDLFALFFGNTICNKGASCLTKESVRQQEA